MTEPASPAGRTPADDQEGIWGTPADDPASRRRPMRRGRSPADVRAPLPAPAAPAPQPRPGRPGATLGALADLDDADARSGRAHLR